MVLDKELKEKINYLFAVLDKNDVKEVRIDFYGSGDDGNMELGETFDKSSTDKNFVRGSVNWDEPTIFDRNSYCGTTNMSLYELITDVSDHLLDMKGVDYSNGDGNQGCVVFDVVEKQVNLSYIVRQDEECSIKI